MSCKCLCQQSKSAAQINPAMWEVFLGQMVRSQRFGAFFPGKGMRKLRLTKEGCWEEVSFFGRAIFDSYFFHRHYCFQLSNWTNSLKVMGPWEICSCLVFFAMGTPFCLKKVVRDPGVPLLSFLLLLLQDWKHFLVGEDIFIPVFVFSAYSHWRKSCCTEGFRFLRVRSLPGDSGSL